VKPIKNLPRPRSGKGETTRLALPSAPKIYQIRGLQVVVDSDLAAAFELPTFRINEAVKRNSDRFPEDFCFQLTHTEWQALISQFAISNEQVVDSEEKLFFSNVVGNVVDELGNIVVDNLQQIFYGNVIGDVVNDIGAVVVDSNEKLFFGNEFFELRINPRGI
jgi:hypothetical protein